MEVPEQVKFYIQNVHQQKQKKQELKTLRQNHALIENPVLEWMDSNDIDVVNLSSHGVQIERIDKQVSASLTKDLRMQVMTEYFETVDNVDDSPAHRAQKLIAMLDNKGYRPTKQVMTLTCKIKRV